MKRRFVDAHMHLWDLGVNPWYHFPVPGNDFGLGMKEPFPDRYVLPDYLRSMAEVELTKCVHVTAVTGAQDVEAESAWIAKIAAGNTVIRAIVGTVDSQKPFKEIAATLDREVTRPLYRGIRLLAGIDYDSASASMILRALASRDLVYDAVTHSEGGILAAAKGLKRHDGLTVVLEHTGWPMATGGAAFQVWRREMKEFAALPNTHCKLSGMGMVVHSTDLDVFRAYFDSCIEFFGPDRCLFASNFPVDLCYGSPADLFRVFEETASRYSAEEAAALFERTSERIYRI